jgi:hypothetical protein
MLRELMDIGNIWHLTVKEIKKSTAMYRLLLLKYIIIKQWNGENLQIFQIQIKPLHYNPKAALKAQRRG